MSRSNFAGRIAICDVPNHPDFFDLTTSAAWALDLRYASANNFLARVLYGDLPTHYLHREAAERLLLAAQHLKRHAPQAKLLLLDGLRPASVQVDLWAAVEGTAQEKYIADPRRGSIHSFGLAIDLTLIDANGVEFDMGTPFDEFDALAEPQLEEQFLREGRLSPAQINNRKLLRTSMEAAGFLQNPEEWWHYDALAPQLVRSHYALVE